MVVSLLELIPTKKTDTFRAINEIFRQNKNQLKKTSTKFQQDYYN